MVNAFAGTVQGLQSSGVGQGSERLDGFNFTSKKVSIYDIKEAIEAKDPELALALLNKKIDLGDPERPDGAIYSDDGNKTNLIHLAAEHGLRPVALSLLNNFPKNFSALNDDGESARDVADKFGQTNITQMLDIPNRYLNEVSGTHDFVVALPTPETLEEYERNHQNDGLGASRLIKDLVHDLDNIPQAEKGSLSELINGRVRQNIIEELPKDYIAVMAIEMHDKGLDRLDDTAKPTTSLMPN
jgi:hypothetical protein